MDFKRNNSKTKGLKHQPNRFGSELFAKIGLYAQINQINSLNRIFRLALSRASGIMKESSCVTTQDLSLCAQPKHINTSGHSSCMHRNPT